MGSSPQRRGTTPGGRWPARLKHILARKPAATSGLANRARQERLHWVRTGVIGNKRTGGMGYSSEHYVLEKCEPHGRDDSICNVGAERAIYGERTVRAVRHQPQDRL